MAVTIMKKTKNLKTRVGIFKNMGGNISGGNFPDGSFPDTNIFYLKTKILADFQICISVPLMAIPKIT